MLRIKIIFISQEFHWVCRHTNKKDCSRLMIPDLSVDQIHQGYIHYSRKTKASPGRDQTAQQMTLLRPLSTGSSAAKMLSLMISSQILSLSMPFTCQYRLIMKRECMICIHKTPRLFQNKVFTEVSWPYVLGTQTREKRIFTFLIETNIDTQQIYTK